MCAFDKKNYDIVSVYFPLIFPIFPYNTPDSFSENEILSWDYCF